MIWKIISKSLSFCKALFLSICISHHKYFEKSLGFPWQDFLFSSPLPAFYHSFYFSPFIPSEKRRKKKPQQKKPKTHKHWKCGNSSFFPPFNVWGNNFKRSAIRKKRIKKGSVLLNTSVNNLAQSTHLPSLQMTPNWRGQEEEWMCSRAGLLFSGNSVSRRDGSAKTLWNSTRTDAKSCPWEGRPPGSYRQGAEELGSSSAKEARGSWLAPSGTWASNAPWQQGHPAAPWAALATAPPAGQGKGPSIFRPDLGCCLQLGLPVEKRLGQTRASLGYPQDG